MIPRLLSVAYFLSFCELGHPLIRISVALGLSRTTTPPVAVLFCPIAATHSPQCSFLHEHNHRATCLDQKSGLRTDNEQPKPAYLANSPRRDVTLNYLARIVPGAIMLLHVHTRIPSTPIVPRAPYFHQHQGTVSSIECSIIIKSQSFQYARPESHTTI